MAIEIHTFSQINKTKSMQSETYTNQIVAKNFFKYNPSGQTVSAKRKIAMCLASLFIGAINGLFGAGGGMLAVPCLTYVWGLDEKSAHATAIAVILPLCLVSSVVYALKGNYEPSVILPTVIGVTIGGIVGALLLKKMSANAVSFLFYALMTFAGFKMIFD